MDAMRNGICLTTELLDGGCWAGRAEAVEPRRLVLASWGEFVVHIRRPFGDAMISIGALALLLVALVAVDERVRQQVSLRLVGGTAQAELRGAGVHVRNLAGVIVDAARYQSIEHAPMVLFVLAASVLFVLMLRS